MDNIFNLFRAVAENNNQIAVETHCEKISYSELLACSIAYAEWLSDIRQNRFAIACSSISSKVISMMLAAFANGKSCLLIDANRSQPLNAKLLKAARCKRVLDEAVISKLPTVPQMPYYEPEEIGVDDEGYVVTTSGSTGAPKVILGSHAGLAQFILWQKERFFASNRRVAQITNCTFDVIYREIFTTLISGSTLVIPERDLKYLSGDKMKSWLQVNHIDTLHMVPSLSNLWMKTILENTAKHTIKTVFFAGEMLQKQTVKNMTQHFDVEQFVNLYGPSETTLAKVYYEFASGEIDKYPQIPVGFPLPATTLQVENTGEIWIKTKYPSLGYIDNNPFIIRDEERWYPTGDRGYIQDGILFLAGRLDDQIKINGVRVHLNEINVRLGEVEGVIESCTVQNDRGKLFGFYTGKVAEDVVHSYLKQALRQEIVPSALRQISAMPTTPSGKINRKQLIELANAQSDASLSNDFLFNAWRRVTGYQGEITDGDNVFELGGDSLDIVSFAAELTLQTGVGVEYWDVYDRPTLNALRQFINSKPAVGVNQPGLTQRGLTCYPLSPQQARYKNIYIPFSNGNWCNMIAVWDVNKAAIPKISAALMVIIQRHDALQSFYHAGQMHLVEASQRQQVGIEQVRCEDFNFDEVLASTRVKTAEKTIDISQWPLFSMTVVESPNHQRIIWNIHHLICDGFSQGIIKSELDDVIGGVELPPKPNNYSDYAVSQSGPSLESKHYWAKVYQKQYNKIELEVKYPEFGARGGETSIGLGESQTLKLKHTAKAFGCTPFSLLLATYFLCLHDFCANDDIVVGTPALGRMNRFEEAMVGNFISLVTVRSDLSSKEARHRRTYLSHIHESIYMAMKHQDFQYDELVRAQGYPLEQDRFPLTTFFISLLNRRNELAPLNEGVYQHRSMGGNVKFDMMLYVDAYADRWVLRSQYRLALFSHRQQASFGACYLAKLNDLFERELSCGLF